jgi:hypothetical protein
LTEDEVQDLGVKRHLDTSNKRKKAFFIILAIWNWMRGKIYKMNNEKTAIRIVRKIIGDIYGRYGLDYEFRSIHPKQQIEIYEEWIRLTSEVLGVEYKKFEPEDLVDAANHISFYLHDEDDDI